jgi:hypothetical protein
MHMRGVVMSIAIGLLSLVGSRIEAQSQLSVVHAPPLLSNLSVSYSAETVTGGMATSTGNSVKGGAIAGAIVGVVFGTIFVIANDESTGTRIGYGLAIVAIGAGAGALLGLLLSGAD